ncbi:hypothetical protein BDR04DRAFT_1109167 [Suillus decipiens]|nr:hypothetical protein BDR04DRAFT_1109167 [Suillus decipiens]
MCCELDYMQDNPLVNLLWSDLGTSRWKPVILDPPILVWLFVFVLTLWYLTYNAIDS